MSRQVSTIDSVELAEMRQKIHQAEIKDQKILLKDFLCAIKHMVQDKAARFLPDLPNREAIVLPQVFLSYAWEVGGTAKFNNLRYLLKRLAKDLKIAGLTPWLDIHHMTGNLDRQMRENIKKSRYVLLIGTNRYAERTKDGSDTNVRKELDFTLEAKKSADFLLPLMLEGSHSSTFIPAVGKELIRDCRGWYRLGYDLGLMSAHEVDDDAKIGSGKIYIRKFDNNSLEYAVFCTDDEKVKRSFISKDQLHELTPLLLVEKFEETQVEKCRNFLVKILQITSRKGHTYHLEQKISQWQSFHSYLHELTDFEEKLGILPTLLGLSYADGDEKLKPYRDSLGDGYKEQRAALRSKLELSKAKDQIKILQHGLTLKEQELLTMQQIRSHLEVKVAQDQKPQIPSNNQGIEELKPKPLQQQRDTNPRQNEQKQLDNKPYYQPNHSYMLFFLLIVLIAALIIGQPSDIFNQISLALSSIWRNLRGQSREPPLISNISKEKKFGPAAPTLFTKTEESRGQKEIQDQLITACKEGNEDFVKRLLEMSKQSGYNYNNKSSEDLLGAAVWGMNPAVVDALLKMPEVIAPITWEVCEQHNLRHYNGTFIISEFEPRTYGEWYKLLEKIDKYPFLQKYHLRMADEYWHDSDSSSWENWKNFIDRRGKPSFRSCTVWWNGEVNFKCIATTQSGYANFREEIKKLIQSIMHPAP